MYTRFEDLREMARLADKLADDNVTVAFATVDGGPVLRVAYTKGTPRRPASRYYRISRGRRKTKLYPTTRKD